MPQKNYSALERKVLDHFNIGSIFSFHGRAYKVLNSGKPKTQGGGGEPKTDVYIQAREIASEQIIELKISVKMDMANIFVENKVTKERFNEIFSSETNEKIKKSLYSEIFPNILKKIGNVEKRRKFPLGWKCEIAINDTRINRVRIRVSPEEAEEIYAGNKRPNRYKDALVNNKIIRNSGIAEYMLSTSDQDIEKSDDVLSQLVPIKEYVQNETNRVFDIILTGCNLFITDKKPNLLKWDGDRPLLVGMIWDFERGFLKGTLDLVNLFEYSGNITTEYFKIACNKAKISMNSEKEFWKDYENNVLEEILESNTSKVEKPFNRQKKLSIFFKK